VCASKTTATWGEQAIDSTCASPTPLCLLGSFPQRQDHWLRRAILLRVGAAVLVCLHALLAAHAGRRAHAGAPTTKCFVSASQRSLPVPPVFAGLGYSYALHRLRWHRRHRKRYFLRRFLRQNGRSCASFVLGRLLALTHARPCLRGEQFGDSYYNKTEDFIIWMLGCAAFTPILLFIVRERRCLAASWPVGRLMLRRLL
jgi:hypothetical protein